MSPQVQAPKTPSLGGAQEPIGYTALTHRDETLALELLEEHRELVRARPTRAGLLPGGARFDPRPARWDPRSHEPLRKIGDLRPLPLP